MLIYTGEETPVGVDKQTELEVFEPAIKCDVWKAVQQLFPHKMPTSPYLSGLTYLDRRVLQLIISAERTGGAMAIESLVIILAVDSAQTQWVAEQVLAKSHWSLKPHQILVVSIARFPGMIWDQASKTFRLYFSGSNAYVSAGTGYAFLSLAWPSHAFTVTADGREYLAGSVLQSLSSKGVKYLYSSQLCDYELLSPSIACIDPFFVGPSLYMFDVHGANMSMQVVTHPTDQVARANHSIVLSPVTGKLFSSSVALCDVQSANAWPLIHKQVQAASVVSCVSRYFMCLDGLKTIMTGPNAFHIKAQVQVPCMHIELDACDLTSHPAANCVAIAGKGKGPFMHIKTFSREWIREMVPNLIDQDGQAAMRQKLAKISVSATAFTPVPPTGPMAGAANATSPSTPQAGGSKILLFVHNGAASRVAFRLAISFLTGRDTLYVVTVAAAGASESDGNKLLGSFTDIMADDLIQRKLVRMRDRLVDTMLSEVELIAPDLVVTGSDMLSKMGDTKSGAGSQSLNTSIAVSLVKAVTDIPILVVKSSTCGELLADSGLGAGCKKVILEVAAASTEAIKWLCPRLTPDRDKLVLVRPLGIGKDGKETPVSQRMTQALATEAQYFRLSAKRMPMSESLEGFNTMVVNEKCDVLALVTPNAKVTPQPVIDLVRTARTSILVWRPQGGGGAV